MFKFNKMLTYDEDIARVRKSLIIQERNYYEETMNNLYEKLLIEFVRDPNEENQIKLYLASDIPNSVVDDFMEKFFRPKFKNMKYTRFGCSLKVIRKYDPTADIFCQKLVTIIGICYIILILACLI